MVEMRTFICFEKVGAAKNISPNILARAH